MIPRFMFKDLFTIKKTEQVITTGKITHTLSTVSTGSIGRFEPLGGSKRREFMGNIKQYSMKLYCDYDANIIAGRIIVKENDSSEYDVVYADSQTWPGRNHHMEVGLEQRRTSIV